MRLAIRTAPHEQSPRSCNAGSNASLITRKPGSASAGIDHHLTVQREGFAQRGGRFGRTSKRRQYRITIRSGQLGPLVVFGPGTRAVLCCCKVTRGSRPGGAEVSSLAPSQLASSGHLAPAAFSQPAHNQQSTASCRRRQSVPRVREYRSRTPAPSPTTLVRTSGRSRSGG